MTIADSFDYQNKYAIVEYLKEMAEDSFLKMIVMTHNFDFFRTAQDRICSADKFEGSSIAIKEEEGTVRLEQIRYRYVSNPFNEWKKDFKDPAKVIASIPFARNLAEYIGDKANLSKLTLLHIKSDTYDYNVQDLECIYADIFGCQEIQFDPKMLITELIFDQADAIAMDTSYNGINLENKIVLSIAIRLKAEEYMIEELKLCDANSISKNQTKLFGCLKKNFLHGYKI